MTPLPGAPPGMYIDKDGCGHFSLPEMLEWLEMPDTPENQAWLRKEMEWHLRQIGAKEIFHRKTPDDTVNPNDAN